MNDKKLSALKALAEAATPGPWFVQHGDDYNFMNMTAISTEDRGSGHHGELTSDNLIAVTFHQSQPWVACELDDLGDSNSAYIAAANPTTILSLISRLEQTEAASNERANNAIDQTILSMRENCAKGDNTSVDLIGVTLWHHNEFSKEMHIDPCGEYVKFTDVQAILATPARDVGGLTDA